MLFPQKILLLFAGGFFLWGTSCIQSGNATASSQYRYARGEESRDRDYSLKTEKRRCFCSL